MLLLELFFFYYFHCVWFAGAFIFSTEYSPCDKIINNCLNFLPTLFYFFRYGFFLVGHLILLRHWQFKVTFLCATIHKIWLLTENHLIQIEFDFIWIERTHAYPDHYHSQKSSPQTNWNGILAFNICAHIFSHMHCGRAVHSFTLSIRLILLSLEIIGNNLA